MIQVTNLTKRYGSERAVDGLSFEVSPGKVTGFLDSSRAGPSRSAPVVPSDRAAVGAAKASITAFEICRCIRTT